MTLKLFTIENQSADPLHFFVDQQERDAFFEQLYKPYSTKFTKQTFFLYIKGAETLDDLKDNILEK